MNMSGYARDHFSMILVVLLFLAILVVSWKYISLFILALSLAMVTLSFHRKVTNKIPAPLSAGILTPFIFGITGYDIFIKEAGRKNTEGLVYEKINV